jgi:uncharacterized Zn-finger protein
MMNDADLTKACSQRLCELTHQDLPLSCPMPDQRLWDAHPKVYLPIAESGREICPYCGTEYILTDFEPTES